MLFIPVGRWLPDRSLTVLTVAVALLLGFGSGARAQQVGMISQLTGSAQIHRGAATLAAAVNIAVELHDELRTAAASTLTITLIDNSTLSMYESSTLVLDDNVVSGGVRKRTLVRLLSGSIRALVRAAPVITPNNFDVQTPNAVMGVRGTDFDATYTEGTARPGYEGCERYTDVAVREGTVAIYNLAHPAAVVEVAAGYETTVPCLLPPLAAGPLGITGAAGPGMAGGARTSAAAGVAGFAAPPPGVGSSPPPIQPPVRVVQ